jgi:hypothetical protein
MHIIMWAYARAMPIERAPIPWGLASGPLAAMGISGIAATCLKSIAGNAWPVGSTVPVDNLQPADCTAAFAKTSSNVR